MTITTPANAQPSSKLLNGVFALESKFGALAALVGELTGGQGLGGLGSSSSSSTSTSASASG